MIHTGVRDCDIQVKARWMFLEIVEEYQFSMIWILIGSEVVLQFGGLCSTEEE
jgi:hypothetical protein